MNSGLQKRLYEMEVVPPEAVWERLSANIDEINADNLIGKKVLNAEFHPPASAWENIHIAINTEEKKEPAKRGFIVNFKRLAAAAIFIGVLVTAWLIFRDNIAGDTLAGVQNEAEKKSEPGTNPASEKKIDSTNLNNLPSPASVAIVNPGSPGKNKPDRIIEARRNRNYTARKTPNLHYGVLNNEAPYENSFAQPIDDLSLVTSHQNYLTMVNANGRLVKIPAQFASLAPHLQNKPVSEDYYEVMFGEGAYWQETLNEWRRKVASLPVSSGDAFTSFIELLKTVQDK
jgi:hypothetical protein